jgi:hypothetical protein
MRRFDDDDGQSWEVVAGRESWGALFAIFIPVDGPEGLDMRQAPLSASSYEEATADFDVLDDVGLRELLGRSEPKTF